MSANSYAGFAETSGNPEVEKLLEARRQERIERDRICLMNKECEIAESLKKLKAEILAGVRATLDGNQIHIAGTSNSGSVVAMLQGCSIQNSRLSCSSQTAGRLGYSALASGFQKLISDIAPITVNSFGSNGVWVNVP